MPYYLYSETQALIEAVTVRSKWARLRKPQREAEDALAVVWTQQQGQFMDSFDGLRTSYAEGRRIREAITEDDWLRIWDQVTDDTYDRFIGVVQNMMQQGLSIGAAVQIANVATDYAFDLSNPRAVAYIEEFGALRVTQINETTRDEIHDIVTQGTREGWSYDRVARAINQRFREFRVGKPQEHIKSRGHLVAVTELGNAYEAGNQVVVQDLSDGGLDMEKKWLTVGDDRVSDGCRENESEGWIPVEQAFLSGHDRPLRFPGCRCTALYRRAQG